MKRHASLRGNNLKDYVTNGRGYEAPDHDLGAHAHDPSTYPRRAYDCVHRSRRDRENARVRDHGGAHVYVNAHDHAKTRRSGYACACARAYAHACVSGYVGVYPSRRLPPG